MSARWGKKRGFSVYLRLTQQCQDTPLKLVLVEVGGREEALSQTGCWEHRPWDGGDWVLTSGVSPPLQTDSGRGGEVPGLPNLWGQR